MNLYHHTIRRIAALMVCGWLLIAVTILPWASAAEGVAINSQTVNCDSISVTYTVSGAALEDYALLFAHRQDGTQIGLANGPGTNGQHTVVIPINPAEPAGSVLYGRVSVGVGEIGRAEASGAPTACGDTGEPDVPGPSPDEAGNPWPGFSDGRLNPALAEYYSVWCQFDRVEVWRHVPRDEVIAIWPLVDILALGDGGTLTYDPFMTLVRTGDTVTIYGSNGNLAPEPGSKSFSLNECIARNGGTPDLPPPDDTGGLPPGENIPDEPNPAQERIDFCLRSYEFLQDPWLFIGCLSDATTLEGSTGAQYLWLLVFQTCMGLPLGAVPLALVFAGKRRRGRLIGRQRDD